MPGGQIRIWGCLVLNVRMSVGINNFYSPWVLGFSAPPSLSWVDAANGLMAWSPTEGEWERANLCRTRKTALGLGRTGRQTRPGEKVAFPGILNKLLERVETESLFNQKKAAVIHPGHSGGGLLDRDVDWIEIFTPTPSSNSVNDSKDSEIYFFKCINSQELERRQQCWQFWKLKSR